MWSERRALTGWGRTAPSVATVVRPRSSAEVAALLADPPLRGLIARGLGRSYGDAAQDAGGTVLDCTGLAPALTVDIETGMVTCSAGMSLDRLLRDLVPVGWFLPVTPGTRQVTVGGAIAADVHGKNHHVDGSFGAAVRSLELALPGGDTVKIGPNSPEPADRRLFDATVGGMGLTGVICSATFQCRPIATSWMLVDTERAPDLDRTMERLSAGDATYRYSVAWIDLLARGSAMGRSVLTRGDHAEPAALPPGARRTPLAFAPRTRLAAPPWAPPGLLNRYTVAAFNRLWFAKAPRERRGEPQEAAAFFHPLDGVTGWNRMYGPRGMVQHQTVLPFGAEDTLRRIVDRLSASRVASFLAVLKRLGPQGDGMLSFPKPGWTLALDIAVGDRRLPAMLRELDELVAAAGGRVYLAKDATLDAALLPAMYPRLGEFLAVRARIDPDGVLRSDLARRLEIA